MAELNPNYPLGKTAGGDYITKAENISYGTGSVKDALDNASGSGGLVSTTWSALKALRDAGTLVTGTWYRITDYQCTTVQKNTRSAGHQFDIVVLATAIDTLNENAFAIMHVGDTYFENNDLNAWVLKYSLDNDTDRFAWADTTNGKGVIYYMKDEFNNECPYDFKNIQFKRFKIDYTKLYCSDSETAMNVFTIFKTILYTVYTSTDVDYMSFYYGGRSAYNGDIYEMYISGADVKNAGSYSEYTDINGDTVSIDDFDDDAIFTCLFDDLDNDILAVVTDPQWFYTFSIKASYSDIPTDASLFIDNNVMNNNIGIYKDSDDNKIKVNNIIFIGSHHFLNTFRNNCYSNTFGQECYSITFGDDCSNNTFGKNCESNTFGRQCNSNTFGIGCNSNIFGEQCKRNTFINYCTFNTFGKECTDNIFYNDGSFNILGDNCSDNTFGRNCKSNTFGNDCNDNIFNKSYSRYNELKAGVSFVILDSTAGTTSSSSLLKNIVAYPNKSGTSSSKTTIDVPADEINSSTTIIYA